ncbi:SapC family protein [Henriciella marina]|uniref:SapC family protein n=1 Tax=Henriciella marina TaxID=453851 RepID=UPI00039FC326|nr:SapC family protein [Henriciella marina]
MANSQSAQPSQLSGQVLFYSNPQPLNVDKHGGLGLKQIEKPFSFLGKAHAVPLTVNEFGLAATSYPVIFVGADKMPIGAMGVRENENLYVKDGQIDSDFYVPAFARRYPFVFANDTTQERLVLCVDRDAPMVTNKPEIPFFTDGQPSEFTTNAMNFCRDFEGQRRRTEEFVKEMDKLGLFSERTASFQPRDNQGNSTGESQVVAKYWSIDEEKLNALPDAKLVELQRNGMLGACFAQIMSLLNWSRVINRALRAQSNEAVQEPQGGSTGPSLQI